MSSTKPAAVVPRRLQIIRRPELRERLGGCSDHYIDGLEQRNEFPRRVQLGNRSIGWIENEVEAWIEARMRERYASQQRTEPRDV
jgi:prophage regulatory protein